MSGEGPGKPPKAGSDEFELFGAVERQNGLSSWWESLCTLVRDFRWRDLWARDESPAADPEDDALFSHLVDSAPRKKKKRFGWGTSAVAHIGIISAVVLVPLLWPGAPPATIDYVRVLIYDPPPPPPPPPPKGSDIAKPTEKPKPVSPKPTPEATPTPKLVADLEVPEKIPDKVTPDPTTMDQAGSDKGHELGMTDGVEGGDPYFGVVGGVPGGVPGGVVGGTGTIPVFDYDRPPKPIKITKPRYPQEAFIKKIEGTVTLEILIDEKGNVTPVRILESIPMLDAAAMRTVQEWQFMPAIKGGRRVATIARAPVTFTIF